MRGCCDCPRTWVPHIAEAAVGPDGRADLHALGATVYHALTGQPPIPGTTPLEVLKGHVERAPKPLGEIAPKIPEALSAIVMRLLTKPPAERFQSAAALLDALAPLCTA